MGVLGTYCFDGLNFSQASSLYTDSALTILADDGFYSQGGIVRRQLNGVLLVAQACESCFSVLNLCFALTENELCCGTSEPRTVYVSGNNITSLANVTGFLYKTSDLTIKAEEGYYSDDSGITCTAPAPVATYQIDSCISAMGPWTLERGSSNFEVTDVVQFRLFGGTTTYCGTITALNNGTPDATLYNEISSYSCDDTVHCPQS
jgi:hypothetical protein